MKKRKKTFVVELGTSRELIGPFATAGAAQRATEKVFGNDTRYSIRPVLSPTPSEGAGR